MVKSVNQNLPSNKWIERFLDLAKNQIATWSKDPSTQVGCVLAKGKDMLTDGYNGYPEFWEDVGLENREEKYGKIIHAEINALRNLKKYIKLENLPVQMYVTHFPCVECAKRINPHKVDTIVVPRQMSDYLERWGHLVLESWRILDKAGIKTYIYTKEGGLVPYSHSIMEYEMSVKAGYVDTAEPGPGYVCQD